MAKKTMNLKYKKAKRERKNKQNIQSDDDFKSILKTVIIVIITLGIMYLLMLGMEALGVFQLGYTSPTKDETEISQKYINIGTVFNRDNDEYYVLFDNYENEYTKSTYINYLIDKVDDIKVYKVDMSKKENAKYSAEEENPDAENATELKINGITLIKIKNGRIEDYISGKESIEEYLND